MKSSSQSIPRRGPKLHPADWVVKAGAVNDVLGEVDRLLVRQRRRQKSRLKAAGAGLVCIAAALWAVPYFKDTATVTTIAAHQQSLDLQDGSRAELNARTNLHTDFRYGRRVVQLTQGEAFFSVRKDPAHPFLVETPAGTIHVTGTKFNVRLDRAGTPEVTLVEGGVNFAGEGATATLAPGQQLRLTEGRPAVRNLTDGEMERRLAWRGGRAVFDGDTLLAATAQFAEYHGVTITVEGEAANFHLGGSYPLTDMKQFIEALETTLPVRVLHGESAYRIVAK